MMTMTALTVWFFSDEATFYVSGKVNKRNIRIWGSENPCEVVEKERDSPKINVEWSTCFILCCKLTPLLKMIYS